MISNFLGRHLLLHKTLLLAYSVFTLYVGISIAFHVSRSVTDENVFQGNTSKIEVTSVLPGGASDRAGMQVGDIIISINGQTFISAMDADQRILRNSEPGQIMDYEVIRKNALTEKADTLILKVQAAKIGIGAQTVILSISFFAFLILGIYLGFARPENQAARHLSWFLVFMSIIPSLLSMAMVPQINTFHLVTISNSIFIGFYIGLYTDLLLPEKDKQYRQAKRIVDISFWISFLLYLIQIFFFTDYGSSLLNQKFDHPISDVIKFLPVSLGICLYIVVGIITRYGFREKSSNQFLKPIYYSWALFGIAAGIFFNLAIRTNGIYYYGLILTMAPPVMWFYFIVNKRLFGINIAINRSFQYTIINTIFWIFLIIGYFWLLNAFSELSLGNVGFRLTPTALEVGTNHAPGFSDRPFFILIGILSFVWLVYIKRKGQAAINQLFLKEEYNYQSASSEISEIIATQISEHKMTELLTAELKKIMMLKGVAIFTKNENNFSLKAQSGLDEKLLESINCQACYNELSNSDKPFGIEKTNQEEAFRKASIQFIAPMKIKNNCIGMILLGEKESQAAYKKRDIEFIQSLSVQIAVGIENTRLSDKARQNDMIKRDLELARKIQMNLLPTSVPDIPNLELAGLYIPANEVGGDYYDFLLSKPDNSVNDKVTIIVGDVSGKGISASLYMSRVQGIIRSLNHTESFSPKQLLSHTNQLIYSDMDKYSFITMVCASFNVKTNMMTFSRAGHLPILHYSAKHKSVTEKLSQGLALGLRADNLFNENLGEETVLITSGDIFVFYSDGIIEAMNQQEEEYGFARIPKIIQNHASDSAAELVEKIKKDVFEFIGSAVPNDDITMVVVKVK